MKLEAALCLRCGLATGQPWKSTAPVGYKQRPGDMEMPLKHRVLEGMR
jgi:hypothetical protein